MMAAPLFTVESTCGCENEEAFDPEAEFGREKAAKNDDAGISTGLCDARVWSLWQHDTSLSARISSFEAEFGQGPLESIRGFLLARWRRNVCRIFRRFLVGAHPRWHLRPRLISFSSELLRDLEARRDCLSRTAGASWWDWEQGSRLFFWRWPAESRVWARDGHPVYHQAHLLPNYRTCQPPEHNPEVREQVAKKLSKFRDRGYMERGAVKSLTPYFTVPKGDGDVRVVFDGTRSGLNDSLWAPPFVLPTISSLLRAVEPGTWMSDIDIGEMFYNFSLDPALQECCGVDLCPYYPQVTSWERWTRCVMGIKSSPHGCTKMEMLGEELAKGDSSVASNPFAFQSIRLNLPGSPDYSLALPWVSKVCSTGRIAADVKTYVDDKRVTGTLLAVCNQATRRASSMLTYLGIQDACRKRVLASQRAGAWAGSICHSDADQVTVRVTPDKWTKAKLQVQALLHLATTTNQFDYKELESIRGFLIYVVRTYPAFNPFLKGLHLMLDSWRPGR